MEKEPNPRQQLKIRIFEAYRNCIVAPSPDILSKHKGQLWVLIDRWCRKYLFVKEWEKEAVENIAVEEMVADIPDVIDVLVKENRTIKTFEKPGEFIMYLNECLKNKKKEIFFKLLPESVTKARVKKYYKINRLIKTMERDGKLTENDRIKIITNYMTISEYKEIRDNILYPQNLEDKKQKDDKDKDIDPLNFLNVKSVFNNEPESTNKPGNNKKLKEVFESLFAGIKKEKKPFYRDLITVQLDEADVEWLYDNFEWIHEYLNRDIRKTYNGEIPTNREIYSKYYPNSNNPDQSVSPLFTKFKDTLDAVLKEKNLRIFFRKH